MDGLLFLLFLVSILVVVVLGPVLGINFLTRTEYFLESVFPKDKPNLQLFLSKKSEDSDRLALYLFARLFAACLIALIGLWIVRSFSYSN